MMGKLTLIKGNPRAREHKPGMVSIKLPTEHMMKVRWGEGIDGTFKAWERNDAGEWEACPREG